MVLQQRRNMQRVGILALLAASAVALRPGGLKNAAKHQREGLAAAFARFEATKALTGVVSLSWSCLPALSAWVVAATHDGTVPPTSCI